MKLTSSGWPWYLLGPLTCLKRPSFAFRGRSYRYFHHAYMHTWSNQRAVELAIVVPVVAEAEHRGARILEVGDFLMNYRPCQHEIVDKFGRRPGILAVDVVDFTSPHRYDLIVSISTLPVVGWSESPPRDPGKFLRAVRHLERYLAPNGTLLATLPLAYRPDVDAMSREGRLPFDRVYYLERTSFWRNTWRETARPGLRRRRSSAFEEIAVCETGVPLLPKSSDGQRADGGGGIAP